MNRTDKHGIADVPHPDGESVDGGGDMSADSSKRGPEERNPEQSNPEERGARERIDDATAANARRGWRVRVAVIAAVMAVIIVIAIAVGWGVLARRDDGSGQTAGASSSGTSSSNKAPSSSPSNGGDATANGGNAEVKGLALPFGIDGAPADAAPIEVNAGADAAQLGDAWTFGGDYSAIGSAPVDANTVFGSSSATPDDVYSYAAALIGRDGTKLLEDAPAGVSAASSYFEPQDGTGDAQRLVWRAASIGRTAATAATDNWQLKTWDAASGRTRVLGSAHQLNGRDDTPVTGDTTTPTANARNAYIASNVFKDGAWTEKVLAYALDGGAATEGSGAGAGRVVGEGAYPAATDDGVVYASGAVGGAAAGTGAASGSGASGDGGARLYREVSRVGDASGDSAAPAKVLSLVDDSHAWGVCGVEAHGGVRAVAFCNASDSGAGSWIGLWADDFGTNKAWLHIASPTVVLSLNDNWVVWGSGSQATDPGMFAYRLADGKVDYLGKAAGYSRPAIASGEDVVMVPAIRGDGQAASFTVGRLG